MFVKRRKELDDEYTSGIIRVNAKLDSEEAQLEAEELQKLDLLKEEILRNLRFGHETRDETFEVVR